MVTLLSDKFNMTKICHRCKLNLPLSDFSVNNATPDRLHPTCRSCGKIKRACAPGTKICSWCLEAKPVSVYKIVGSRLAKYCADCELVVAEQQRLKKLEDDRKYYSKNHDEIRDQQVNARLIKRYGITIDEYNQKFDEQGGCCCICGKPHKAKKRMHVDHNHLTGKVRGLLCYTCNSHLGILENQEWIARAKAYLKEHS